jgi:hypothetical protein
MLPEKLGALNKEMLKSVQDETANLWNTSGEREN